MNVAYRLQCIKYLNGENYYMNIKYKGFNNEEPAESGDTSGCIYTVTT